MRGAMSKVPGFLSWQDTAERTLMSVRSSMSTRLSCFLGTALFESQTWHFESVSTQGDPPWIPLQVCISHVNVIYDDLTVMASNQEGC